MNRSVWHFILSFNLIFLALGLSLNAQINRQRININNDWYFMRYDGIPDSLVYDVRPTDFNTNDNIVADTKAELQTKALSAKNSLKSWILPSANEFIKDKSKHYTRPNGQPGKDFPFVQSNFDDKAWQKINLPHDWAINQPFYKGDNVIVGGGMGRLPIQGVAWYRKKIDISSADKGKSIYLDVDGAMSYAMVWLNGNLVGGWPFGYNSFQLDLTPYLNFDGDNQLAIRLDNPANSSRWYPGAGIYRNIWLTKVNPVHVANWGVFVHTGNVSKQSAKIKMELSLVNKQSQSKNIKVTSEIYNLNQNLKAGKKVASFSDTTLLLLADSRLKIQNSTLILNPVLWEPLPSQQQNQYLLVTKIYSDHNLIDEYKTQFGIRSLTFDPLKGLLVNNNPVRIQGVNQHHDLGALGAAFNKRAAQRQLEILKEMGCNAIRLAHNPPAPELLDLTDSMGFLVINESFDCWQKGKTPLDFHLIFDDWHEADLRSFIRRDRNHPSIIAWSFGNEVGEQYTGEEGAALVKKLYDIVKDEDPTRVATASMNFAKPTMPFPQFMDVISLNYQGEGIRNAPEYLHLKGIRTTPLYPAFKEKFPARMIFSSETASALSTRGTYIFPLTKGYSAPVSDSTGGDPINQFVSAYDLYTAQFGASPDKVFASQDQHPYVAGEFVWSGFDYLGEPTPYYGARSSYSGIVDLAGFKKDRFYLYQARWKPELKMAHILPHWNWQGREGLITPVHVYTSADEAELFLNGKSLGRKKRGELEYRFRWDNVIYEPGKLEVVTYKNGKIWAKDKVQTTGKPYQLKLDADRNLISSDGKDLSFIKLSIIDENGLLVPNADQKITFSIEGEGEIVATDNGNPADLVSFSSKERKTLAGLALVIVKSNINKKGILKIKATSNGLKLATLEIQSK